MKKIIVRVTLRIALVAAITLAVIGGSVEAWAERRVALVVGNATYRVANISLANPRNDAEDISRALKTLGFEVVTAVDATGRDMDQALQKFARLATDADSALFFYAGHAMQFQGRNFLMPTDAELEDEISVEYQTISLEKVRSALDRANGVKIMILDACRNNPLADRLQKKISGSSRAAAATTRGLARADKTQGMVVAYATAADDVAQDGQGRNSPFTTALLKRMQEPGLEIEMMFRRVAADVNTQTGGRQRPETTISLLAEYYLNQSDRIVWDRIKDQDDVTALRDFIAKYPSSPLAIFARNKLDMFERFAREREDNARREEAARRDEADRRAREEEQRRKAAEAEAQRIREAEAEAKRKQAEAEAQKKREAEAEAQRKQAEAEAQQKREAEAETKRKQAEAEAQRKREAEAEIQRKQAEAEAKRKQAEAEAQQRREAEAEAKRKQAEADVQRKREAEAEAQRKQAEADAKRKQAEAEAQQRREAEAEAKRKQAEAEAQRKREADAEAQRKQAEAQRKREADRLAALDLQQQDERRREETARQQADLERKRIEETCNREEAKLDELKAAGASARDQLVKLESDAECKSLRQLVTAALKALPADVPAAPVPLAVPVEAPVVKANQPEQVKQAQAELQRLGCFAGHPDGKLNDRTRDAIREFLTRTQQPVVAVNITDEFIADLQGRQTDICLPAKKPPAVADRPQPTHKPKEASRQEPPQEHRVTPHAPAASPQQPQRPAQQQAAPRPTSTNTALGTGF